MTIDGISYPALRFWTKEKRRGKFEKSVRAAHGGGKEEGNQQELIIFAEPPIDFGDPTSHHPPKLGANSGEANTGGGKGAEVGAAAGAAGAEEVPLR